MICNAKDLSPDQKAVIETLLGRRIQEDEAVSVRTFEPVTVSHRRRLEIADELRSILPKWTPPASPFRRKKPKTSSLRP